MNKLATILSTYKSLGVIPDPSNFDAIVSIFQELNFRKDPTCTHSMSRTDIANWLVTFIQSNGFRKEELTQNETGTVNLPNAGTNKLITLRLGSKGDIRNYTDDYDDDVKYGKAE